MRAPIKRKKLNIKRPKRHTQKYLAIKKTKRLIRHQEE